MKTLSFFVTVIVSLSLQAQPPFGDSVILHAFKKRTSACSIVGLGEAGHGYESVNIAKSEMVKLLQSQMGFAAISFESSFTGSIVAYLSDSSLDHRAKRFLYPFWNTASVKAALSRFFRSETDKPLLVGFDIQEDCRFNAFSTLLLDRRLVSLNKEKLLQSDAVLLDYIGRNRSRKNAMTLQEYTQLSNNYETIRKEIDTAEGPLLLKKLISHCLSNRVWLCRYLTLASAKERMFYRDSLMAVNIAWLKKELYANERLIVWSANTHVAKGTGKTNPEWMGEWLSSVYGEKYFAIAFEKGRRGDPFFWQQTFHKYADHSREKFDLTICLADSFKIRPEEWETPCN